MVTNAETLKILASGEFGKLLSGVNYEADSVIRSQINQIPSRFFEPSISIDEESKNKISFMQFFAQAAGMSSARLSGYMEKYGIDPYDVKKIQGIVESIEVAREYGNKESVKKQKEKDTYSYGFSLSSHEQLSKAYPLWVAFLYANSLNPLLDVTAKLREDGVEDKYDAQYIVGLIEHTNEIMSTRTDEEKRNFYMQSIRSILGDEREKNSQVMLEK